MHKSTQTALLTGLLALLPLVSNAQTCKPESIPATTPDSQLRDNGDGTVTDTKTGLMWKQCAEGRSDVGCATGTPQTSTWQAALAQVQTVNASGGFAGYTDWRLPNIKELRSIVERQCYYPAINLTRFPNTSITAFWSSSPDVYSDSDLARLVSFYDGNDNWAGRSNDFQIRLVRSGQ
ncbi:MAG: hypothetical protein BWK73_16215 [Thiothrix lacustris]|uniref:Lcl C-terminal domain-containing protein n=1 Tax=Thiothrix lacustris TaxID=525917 RepID=A0A1Y1QR83_9GAMM|nr:MAG: hypothetical protein BWK73_16215 [Thiothrix lacustris]